MDLLQETKTAAASNAAASNAAACASADKGVAAAARAGMVQPSQYGEHMMGTSILAVEFDGGVVIGADSRTSTGTYVANRASDKLTPVHDRVYCCRSGSAADTQAIAAMVKYYLSMQSMELEGLPRVKTAANLFRTVCYNNKDRLLAGIICGGWDEVDGGSVYSIPIGGTCVRQKFAVGGSGSTYIYGLLDKEFKPDMSREQCIKFVTTGLAHAMSRDGSSGGVIRLAVIDKNGVERMFIPGDKIPFEHHDLSGYKEKE